jgi:adenylyltransferase/sulfurtransferase
VTNLEEPTAARPADRLVLDTEDRHHRQTLIEWWDQARVAAARVLVVGAGALGNEILKNLALLGVGQLLVYDLDQVETSNLSRSVLFRAADAGRPKATIAAQRAMELDPAVTAVAHCQNVMHKAGLGVFHWADIVLCGLDNREARLFVNSACARTRRVWVDGAIEGLAGVVRVFDPAHGPCYECTLGHVDRRILSERRSCAMLARQAQAAGHVPTTVVAASVVAAWQVQEALKWLHGQPVLAGEAMHFHGLWSDVTRVRLQRAQDCPGHDALPEIEPLGCGIADRTVGELLARATERLGPGAMLELSRDVVTALACPQCGTRVRPQAVLGELRERDAACPECGTHRVVEFTGSFAAEDVLANATLAGATLADFGIPPFDVVVARCGLDAAEAWSFDGDAAAVLGPLAGRAARKLR